MSLLCNIIGFLNSGGHSTPRGFHSRLPALGHPLRARESRVFSTDSVRLEGKGHLGWPPLYSGLPRPRPLVLPPLQAKCCQNSNTATHLPISTSNEKKGCDLGLLLDRGLVHPLFTLGAGHSGNPRIWGNNSPGSPVLTLTRAQVWCVWRCPGSFKLELALWEALKAEPHWYI